MATSQAGMTAEEKTISGGAHRHKAMGARACVSELLIAMLGETSFFFKLDAKATKIVVVEDHKAHLPAPIELKAELFAEMATNVRNIELWRQQLSSVDAIKRAYIESLCEFYDEFLNIVDTMRMNHISGIAEASATALLTFVVQWQSRVHYLYRLTVSGRDKTGTELMSMVYKEWSVQCIADWTFNLLELSLQKMSLAFHRLACHWLLDGKLDAGGGSKQRGASGWMIRASRQDAARPSAVERLNAKNVQFLNVSGVSENSNTSSPLINLAGVSKSAEKTHALTSALANNNSSPNVIAQQKAAMIGGREERAPNTDAGGGGGAKSEAIAGERPEIDWERVPYAFSGNAALIRKIFNIGKNVCILREFRRQKIYEYRLEERTKLLEDIQIDKSKLWYNTAERGRLYSIIQQYAEIVGEDVMNEVMVKQRLLDHVAFVQTHFLLLYGDFSMGFYEAIRETPVSGCMTGGGGAASKTTSLRLSTHKLDSMVQECVRCALNFTSAEPRFDALAAHLAGDSGGGALGADEKARSSHKMALRRAISRRATADGGAGGVLYLEDLLRMRYKAPGLISEVLNGHMLKIYARIFETFAPFRVLQCRVDESALRLTDALRRRALLATRRRHASGADASPRNSPVARRRTRLCFGSKDENGIYRLSQLILLNVRRFVTSILGYFFEEVLEVECPRVLATLGLQTDLPALNAAHGQFLSTISVALFLHPTTLPVFDALRRCLKTARRVLKHVDDFVTQLSTDHHDALPPTGLEAENDADMSDERRVQLAAAYTDFLVWTLKLRGALHDVRTAAATAASAANGGAGAPEAKYSPYWQHFEPALLLIPQCSSSCSSTGGEPMGDGGE